MMKRFRLSQIHELIFLLVIIFSKTSLGISISAEFADAVDEELSAEMRASSQMNSRDVDECISRLITMLTEKHASLPEKNDTLTLKFSNLRLSSISFREYIDRLRKYGRFEPAIMIISLIHMDFFVQKNNFRVSCYNIFRLFLVALTITQKYVSDSFCSNKFMAKLGGIPVVELNDLEADFLFSVNFDLIRDLNTYKKYANEIRERIRVDIHQQEPKTPENVHMLREQSSSEQAIFHLPNGLVTGLL